MSSAAPAAPSNVISITAGKDPLTMSLQRHHYRYCANGAPATVNSLIYAEVTDAQVATDVADLQKTIDAVLQKKGGVELLYGLRLTAGSKRIFVVDNTALLPKQKANHFYVIDGPLVWAKMSAEQYQAASAIRRIEEAIGAKVNNGDKTNYLDAKTVRKLDLKNLVRAAYQSGMQFLNKLPASDDVPLGKVSGRSDIIGIVRQLG